jgi:hypothetical protein
MATFQPFAHFGYPPSGTCPSSPVPHRNGMICETLHLRGVWDKAPEPHSSFLASRTSLRAFDPSSSELQKATATTYPAPLQRNSHMKNLRRAYEGVPSNYVPRAKVPTTRAYEEWLSILRSLNVTVSYEHASRVHGRSGVSQYIYLYMIRI